MAIIHYQGESYECREDETLLDAMLRQGVDFPFSCRGGICRVCMHRAESGAVPAAALKGLDERQREQGLFLPCRCRPTGDMHIATVAQATTAQTPATQSNRPQPDLELWQALGEGALMSEILEDFYSQVFEDERLAPFFHGVTQRRAMEKQFLFLRQQITGEKVYFGDRPRNAHHWMVISNELFDYREQLMVECLRRHGLAEPMVQRWVVIENRFRADIVKDEPWKRKMGDVELPLDGYEETVLDVGSLCDGCGAEVDAGVAVRYHLRLGSIYCPGCM
jgi:ferredoxin/truncated hemoglobin YjbI